MASKARGFAAFLIAAGVLLAARAPASAEPSDNEAVVTKSAQPAGKPLSLVKPAAAKKIAKSHAPAKLASRLRKPKPVASAKRPRIKTVAAKLEVSADDAALPKTIPAKIADARAQVEPPVTPADSDATTASTTPMEIAAADQLNELDRALTESPAKPDDAERAVTQVIAAPPVAAAPAPSLAQISNSRPANESSLVGNIFIAFGGLLTLASAARMLIA